MTCMKIYAVCAMHVMITMTDNDDILYIIFFWYRYIMTTG